MTELKIQMIGVLESPFKKRFGTPRQGLLTPSTKAFIRLHAPYRDGLDGLSEYSHLWIVSYLHQSEPIQKLKIRPPRLRGQKLGVFATRGPHRPNPIGLSAVRILKVENEGVWVMGVDLIDQTPIVDIKPYISKYDSIEAISPSWIEEKPKIEIQFDPSFFTSLNEQDHLGKEEKEEIFNQIKECLLFDPRPIPYLKREEEIYYLSLGEFEVEVLSRAEVFSVRRIFVRTETAPKAKR